MRPALLPFLLVLSCIASDAHGHGVPINVFVNDDTNQLYNLPIFDSGPFLPFAFEEQILTGAPGIGVSNFGNGFEHGERIGMNITQSLLYSDGAVVSQAPGEIVVHHPEKDGFDGSVDSPVAFYSVTSHTGYQQGLIWGAYSTCAPTGPNSCVQVPGWDAHGLYHLITPQDATNFFDAPPGIYGLVVQLTSPDHLPTDPFLIPLEYDPFNRIDQSIVEAAAGQLEQLVFPLAAADVNIDGDVDGGDLMDMLLGVEFNAAMRQHGDTDSNGIVDRADFLVWQSQAGFQSSESLASIGAIAVPEPTTLASAIAFLVIYLCTRTAYPTSPNSSSVP